MFSIFTISVYNSEPFFNKPFPFNFLETEKKSEKFSLPWQISLNWNEKGREKKAIKITEEEEKTMAAKFHQRISTNIYTHSRRTRIKCEKENFVNNRIYLVVHKTLIWLMELIVPLFKVSKYSTIETESKCVYGNLTTDNVWRPIQLKERQTLFRNFVRLSIEPP